jgi:hypothetical protein
MREDTRESMPSATLARLPNTNTHFCPVIIHNIIDFTIQDQRQYCETSTKICPTYCIGSNAAGTHFEGFEGLLDSEEGLEWPEIQHTQEEGKLSTTQIDNSCCSNAKVNS